MYSILSWTTSRILIRKLQVFHNLISIRWIGENKSIWLIHNFITKGTWSRYRDYSQIVYAWNESQDVLFLKLHNHIWFVVLASKSICWRVHIWLSLFNEKSFLKRLSYNPFTCLLKIWKDIKHIKSYVVSEKCIRLKTKYSRPRNKLPSKPINDTHYSFLVVGSSFSYSYAFHHLFL